MRGRWRTRGSTVLVLASAIAIAYAAATPSDAISVTPRIRVIRHAQGVQGSGAVTLRNTGAAAITIGGITASCGPPPAMRLLDGSGSQAFTIPAGGTQLVALECPAGLPAGMQRCTFDVRDANDGPILSIDGACQTEVQPRLAADRPALDLGTVPLGAESIAHTVTLTGTGAIGVIQLQVDNDNFAIGAPCQNAIGCDAGAGSAVAIDVLCRPLTLGAHSGTLFAIAADGGFLAAPIALTCAGGAASGSGLPVLTATPQALGLGTVEVAGGSASGTITLANAGGAALTVRALSILDVSGTGAGADWSFELGSSCPLPCTLGAGQTLPVAVTFDPSQFRSRPAKLIVGYDGSSGSGSASAQVAIDLAGSGAGATLELASAESTLEFGTLPLTVSGTRTFALQNTGTRPTTARLAIMPAAPFAAPASVVVPPGGATQLNVTCQAAAPVVATAALTIDGGSDVTTAPFALTLRCAVAETQIRSDPSSHAFGELREGGEPVTQQFVIARVGPGSAIAYSAALAGGGDPRVVLSGAVSGTTPGTITATLTPSAIGPLDAAIVITTAAPQPLVVPLGGSIVTLDFEAPGLLSLGTFCVGQPTSPSTVTLQSIGNGRLGLDAPDLGADPSPFQLEALVPASYPALLGAGGIAQLIATPVRRATGGIAEDTLTWRTTIGDAETTLAATFVDDGGAIAPDRLTFAPVPIRFAADNAQQVTLQNCSASELALEPLEVPEPFELDGTFPTTLAPAQRTTFGIAFHPTQIGRFERTLDVASRAGGHFTVTLIGDGVGDPNIDRDDDEGRGTTSFYACTCAGSSAPGGGIAIVLALMWVSLPRLNRSGRRPIDRV
jgi:hypothetical protein